MVTPSAILLFINNLSFVILFCVLKGPETGQYSPGQTWPLQTGRFWHVQRGNL